jgi:dTDP-4-amino-4,6-dideoxygalactose transaminase
VSARREIPIVDLGPGLRCHEAALTQAVLRVLGSGVFVGGPEVESFERDLARYLGVRACVGLNSGTDALVIALRSLGVVPGDEILVPAFGFIASAEAVRVVGAVPVFVDVDARTLNLDPGALGAVIGPRTRGVIAVHLFGQAAPMDVLLDLCQKHGLWLIEDAAQALGGRHRAGKLGALGRAAALSFFPTKNLGACGDAGVLASDDAEVIDAARALRQHGARVRYESERVGYNSRLDALQAAILSVRLPSLDDNVAARRRAADRYDALLHGLELERPYRDPAAYHSFHQYTVKLAPERRDPVRRYLAERGVQTAVYYPIPLHLQPAYRPPAYGEALPRSLPRAEAAALSVLSLPIWPEITESDQARVASTLRAALR